MVKFDFSVGDSGFATEAPYEYIYKGMYFGEMTVVATAIDGMGTTATDEMTFTIYSLGIM
jgi:hypothetical protein